MTPLRILFAGLFAAGVMLYVLNPRAEAFAAFYRLDHAERAEAAARAADSTRTGTSHVFLADRTGRAIGDGEDVPFDRTNYHLGSLYRVDVNADQAGGEWTFLGVAGWFVPVEQPAPGVVEARRAAPAGPPRPPGIPG